MHCYPPGTATCDTTGITMPVSEYDHTLGCSVTGGFVYRGGAYPQMNGLYFFADYCSGRIWGLDQPSAGVWRRTELLDTTHNITSFGLDRGGELYLTDGSDGGVYRVIAPAVAPLPAARPGETTAGAPNVPAPTGRTIAADVGGGVPAPLPTRR
jgi:hypothetical protein